MKMQKQLFYMLASEMPDELEAERKLYASKNPMKEDIVKELRARVDGYENGVGCQGSRILFNQRIDPRDIISQDDWDNHLYTPLLHALQDESEEKFK
jgi:hypothetical protein